MRGFVVIFDRDNSRIGFLGNVLKTSGAQIVSTVMAAIAAVYLTIMA